CGWQHSLPWPVTCVLRRQQLSMASGRSSCPPPVVDENSERTTGLARKLTCSEISIVAAGTLLSLAIQVALTLTAVDYWGADTREA
ncbi:unnamed protein product, partial [Ectocarpus sp. 12 AP-2014]